MSDDSVIEISSDEEEKLPAIDLARNAKEKATFRKALSSVSKEEIKEIVFRLALSNAEVAGLFWTELVEKKEKEVRCRHCNEVFDPDGRDGQRCVRPHKGRLEVNWKSDTWDDWDEDCHGEIDRGRNRREYPEGFQWSCCGKDGKSKGCRTAAHEA